MRLEIAVIFLINLHFCFQDGALNPRDTVLTHASSAICQVCFGQNFNSNDPKLLQLLAINRNFDEAMAASQPVNFWPFLQHFPIVAKSFKVRISG